MAWGSQFFSEEWVRVRDREQEGKAACAWQSISLLAAQGCGDIQTVPYDCSTGLHDIGEVGKGVVQ